MKTISASWRSNHQSRSRGQLYLFLAVALMLGTMVWLALNQAKPADAQTWTQVWSDEFNSSSLNTSNWTNEVSGSGMGNNERQYYTNGNNLIFNGSTLTIQARKENPAGYSCWYGTCTHTSGRIKSQGKREFKYGRIEARLAIPNGQGLWPAFWTLGANIGSVGWPRSGEIDIMEHINTQTQTHGVIHWDNNGHVQYGGVNSNTSVSSFHTYSVEWDSSSIRWYRDGANYHTANILNNINSTEEFHLPHFLLLNLAVGGSWPGDPNSTTPFPSGYQIDYVRVYQQGGGGSGNKALNKPVTCSSVENAGTACANAVDGNSGTRWSSAFSDPQWIRVDLGSNQSITRVKLNWEAAYGKSYQIQTSTDGTNWTTRYSTTTGNGGIDDVTFAAVSARYVRIYGTVRATPYGYSLWDFEVY